MEAFLQGIKWDLSDFKMIKKWSLLKEKREVFICCDEGLNEMRNLFAGITCNILFMISKIRGYLVFWGLIWNLSVVKSMKFYTCDAV